MKKTIFYLLLSMVSLSAFAAAGDTPAEAIPFEFNKKFNLSAELTPGKTTWFSMDMTQVQDLVSPTLALYMENQGSATATVKVDLYKPSNTSASLFGRSTTIAGGVFKMEAAVAGVLLDYDDLLLKVVSTGNNETVEFWGQVFETGRVGEANPCTGANTILVPGAAALTNQNSGSWYNIDLDGYVHGANTGKALKVKVTPQATGVVTIESTFDCPVTSVSRKKKLTTAGNVLEFVLSSATLNAVDEFRAYVHVTAGGKYNIELEEVADPITPITVPTPKAYVLGTVEELETGDNWFSVRYDSLTKQLDIPKVEVIASAAGDVAIDIVYKNGSNYYKIGEQELMTSSSLKNILDTLDVNALMAMTKPADGLVYLNVRNAASNATFRLALNAVKTETLDCASAVDFNWATGATQAAGTSVLYKVDMTSAMQAGKGVQAAIKNLDPSVDATVKAELFFECPCAAPTSRTFTVTAGATKPADAAKGFVPYDAYKNNDIVYVRITTTTNVKLLAEVVADPTPAEDICTLYNPEKLTLPAVIPATPTWYYMEKDDWAAIAQNSVPEITVTNPNGYAVTGTVEVAYDCVVRSTLSYSSTVAANGSVSKTIEYDMLDNYLLKYDKVYFKLSGAGLVVDTTMVNPNVGYDCGHAVDFQYDTKLSTGLANDIWYKISAAEARDYEIIAKLWNATPQTVTATFYSDCGSEIYKLGSLSRHFDAVTDPAAPHDENVGSLLSGYNKEYVLMHLQSETPIELGAWKEAYAGPLFDVCNEPGVVAVKPNIWYEGTAIDTFFFDIKELRALTNEYDSLTLKIEPTNCGDEISFTGLQYWDCETHAKPAEKHLNISGPFEKKIACAVMESFRDSAFVVIEADHCYKFMLEAAVTNDPCHPIELNLDTCITIAAGDTLWYGMDVEDLYNAPMSTGIQVSYKLNGATGAKVMVDKLMRADECDQPVYLAPKQEYVFDHDTTILFSHRLLHMNKLDSGKFAMMMSSTKQLELCFSLVPVADDTVKMDTTLNVCPGDFEDTYFNKIDTVVKDIYNDTVLVYHDSVRLNTILVDSIWTITLHVTKDAQFAQPITKELLKSLEIEAGSKITAYYLDSVLTEYNDTLDARGLSKVDVATVVWAPAAAENYFTDPYPYATSDTLYLTYDNECGTTIKDTLALTLKPNQHFADSTVKDTVCVGEQITVGGVDYVINADTIILDSVRYLVNDTLKSDSVYTHMYYVISDAAFAQPITNLQNLTLEAGSKITDTYLTALLAEYNDSVKAKNWSEVDATKTITWTPAAADNYFTAPRAATDTLLLEYTNKCGNVIKDTLVLTLTDNQHFQTKTVTDTVCAGKEVTIGGQSYTIIEAQTINDTVLYNVNETLKSDSVITYDYKVFTFNMQKPWAGVKPTIKAGKAVEGIAAVETAIQTYVAQNNTYASAITSIDWTYAEAGADGVYSAFKACDQLSSTTSKTAKVAFQINYAECGNTHKDTLLINLTKADELTANVDVPLCYGESFRMYTADGVVALNETLRDTIHNAAKPGVTDQKFDSIYVYKVTSKVVRRDTTRQSICDGDTYTWAKNQKTYTSAGTYLDTLNFAGTTCDSAWIVLELTVNPVYTNVEMSDNVCYSDGTYRWEILRNNSAAVLHAETITLANEISNAGGVITKVDTVPTISGCDSIITLKLNVYPEIPVTIIDTIICSGEKIPANPGGVDKVINASGSYEVMLASIHGCDSLIRYNVIVREVPTLPTAAELGVLPVVVCGEEIQVEAVLEKVNEFFGGLDENYEAMASIAWQYRKTGENAWNNYTPGATVASKAGDAYQVRYVVTTECGSVLESQAFNVVVEIRSTDNDQDIDKYYAELVPKYDNWLILINKKKAEDHFGSLEGAQFFWYAQNGALDHILTASNGMLDMVDPVNPADKDQLLREDFANYISVSDYYITPNGSGVSLAAVPGCSHKYYAVIIMPQEEGNTDDCAEGVRTQVYNAEDNTFNTNPVATTNGTVAAQAPGATNDGNTNAPAVVNPVAQKIPVINPTLIQPGEQIYVYNLDPDVVTTIAIYDMMGECVDRVKVEGQETVAYQTRNAYNGCFLMNISTEKDARSLKFIVK